MKKTSKKLDKNNLKKKLAAGKTASSEYSASSITVLEGLEPVRKRPGMYIGDTAARGLHHLVWEVVDNSIDEAMAGFCTEIQVRLLPDSVIEVTDNGRGVPVEKHKQTKLSALETVLTRLHAGGKFGQGGYRVSGGLHGVGVSVVNALSEWLVAEVRRDGKIWRQEYKRGKAVTKVKAVGKSKETGTTIIFKPDPQVFSTLEFDWETILTHLRQQAYLTKGVWITVVDAREEPEKPYTFFFEGGVGSFVKFLNHTCQPKQSEVFYVEKEVDNFKIEIAVQYVEEFKESVYAFANNIHTIEGGTHLVGFRAALTRTLNNYARTKGYIKEKDANLSGDDVREGLTAVVSVKLTDPQFEGQTKTKLGNEEVRGVVDQVFSEHFAWYLEEHPKDAEQILEKCLLAAQARRAARQARETVLRKGLLEGLALPGKLADCSTKDPSRSELFIVEGDSAGGCFSGDTKIALTDGRNITFRQLVKEHKEGRRNFCYTIKDDGTVGIEEVLNPRVTKKNTEVLKVILDSGEEIVCTPDHPFMLRNGLYKRAEDLGPKDSLMPLKRKISEIGGKITIVVDVAKYNQLREERRDKTLLRFDTFCKRFFGGDQNTACEAVENYNHKIIKVVPLQERIDVYDIEVQGTHNFALASGVFVHNSAKSGRDRDYQAILPLRGKILNVEKARFDKMLANNEIKSLIIALGTAIGEQFDIEKLRYDRIIIMTDADVDGAHIRTLLLTLFYRYFPDIILKEHLYIARPPLYRIQAGKQVKYVFSDEEKEKTLSEFRRTKKEGKAGLTTEVSASIQRYKGLGEMNPDQLWETTMDPEKRVMMKVKVEDAQKASKTFDILMGSEVAPRKRFIQTHAKTVKNLDI